MADIDRNALAALIEAVEDGRLSEVPHDLAKMPRELWEPIVNANSGSLDAAVALHEALLPGWGWARLNDRMSVELNDSIYSARGPSPSRALLLATLRALAAEGGE